METREREITDTEMLDWLEAHDAEVSPALYGGAPWSIDWPGDNPNWDETVEGPTLREAIEAAMLATPEAP